MSNRFEQAGQKQLREAGGMAAKVGGIGNKIAKGVFGFKAIKGIRHPDKLVNPDMAWLYGQSNLHKPNTKELYFGRKYAERHPD